MGAVMDIQHQEPETPSEPKYSMVSVLNCAHSGVSLIYCRLFEP